MPDQSILPKKLINKLAIAAAPLATKEMVELNDEFYHWQKQSFKDYDVNELVYARAMYVDLVLKKVWCQQHLDEHQISLIAVGGYGRGELHPHSDVDILILTQNKISKDVEQLICAFITELWDVRLEIGHSVRSVKECMKQADNDVTIATNLLESRLICGNQQLEQQLRPYLVNDKFWPSERFFVAKREEQVHRHQQYKGAAYTLEPNLKSNPGGLRDIQNISWVALRHFDANDLEGLVSHNYLTENEYIELMECQEYLWRMRFALHVVAGRSENRLLFDFQGPVANMMGFGDDGKAAIERMMKRFFRIINYVSEINEMLLQHFEQAILNKDKVDDVTDIDKHFSIVGNLIKAKSNRAFTRPELFLKLFLAFADNPKVKGIHSSTIRQMRNARRRLISGLNDYAECRRLFIELISHPRGLGPAFNFMHKHDILAAYLPEWRNIVGQMQFDMFHAYSVDEHSYRLMKNLYRFTLEEHHHEFPLCSQIVQRIRKPYILYLAGIFHDIAKGRGGMHSELGAVDALAFGKMHNLTDTDTKMISWLVKYHLLMSVTAQRKDISNPDVIKEFALVVRDQAHLDYLYCLTVADMRATNESLWNSWKSNLLQELYFSTKRAFRRGLEKPVNARTNIRENQVKAMVLLNEQGITEETIKPLWKTFKADYFLRYAPAQISWHSRHIISHDKLQPLVLISDEAYRGGTEVFVYTKARSNIFARIVANLGMKKLSIHDAKILTSKDGYTLNTFVILDSRGQPIKDAYFADDIKTSLIAALKSEEDLCLIKRPIPQKIRQFKVRTQVSFIEQTNRQYTSIEIVTLDRPGLLAEIGQVFQTCSLIVHMAKVTTFGERAEDVFIVSNKNGQPLSIEEQNQLESLLCESDENQ
ncbi:[protein-PII] uridylyltransferase [Thalassotalea crassostreae]|uniref:[protein-PII] uridylyltransferase n=1 Tax=Thalassotalea crassostreae TaxID=1763536 RepID=UPI000B19C08E|nr:[protein-PII] uridylyltransferase [Thalassotalea crassostreae]